MKTPFKRQFSRPLDIEQDSLTRRVLGNTCGDIIKNLDKPLK
ncbi:MAG TPA: hypothetical protein VFZ55_03495 [Nitrososphaera sp.]